MASNKELAAILRNDFYFFMQRAFATANQGTPFLPNWHLGAICHHLYQCWRGDIKRLIITLPPRYGKSICTSVALPAFILGHDPTQRIIVASYGSALATDLSNKTRDIIKDPWYQSVFPNTKIDPAKDTEELFRTTAGGHRLATSIGGSITGMGGNWIIIDDPLKGTEFPSENDLKKAREYYSSTLYSRLDNKNEGCIILIMQRLHEDDPAGHLLAQGGWTHLNLPAIAEESQDIPIGEGQIYHRQAGDVLHPERESLEKLKEHQVDMGPYAFAAQYQQNPTPQGGGIIHWDWFNHYSSLPNNGKGGYIVQSWDTALSVNESSSYSVCTTWFCHQQRYYLVDVWRHRLEYPDLLAFVQSHALQYKADLVIIERNNCSTPLIETLRWHSRLNLVWVQPQGAKSERMIGETALLASGRVLVPNNADWLPVFRNEMIRFPMGKHDDQVDSLSQFLYWVRKGGERHPTGYGFRCQGRPNGPMGPPVGGSVTIIESDPGPLDLSELY